MRRRPILIYRPEVERCEEKQLLSAAIAGAHIAHARPSEIARHRRIHARPQLAPITQTGYLAYRITNPTVRPVHLVPPFLHVRAQAARPVPGQVYNILYVVVKNGTAHTFTASDNFQVRIPGNSGNKKPVLGGAFPILTGNEVWKPSSWVVLYILTKRYYPLSPQAAAGFQLQTGGRSSTLIPGPSGFIAHIPYYPKTIDKIIDFNVAYGQGAQLGPGAAQGIGDTALNILVSAKSDRQDFAGHF